MALPLSQVRNALENKSNLQTCSFLESKRVVIDYSAEKEESVLPTFISKIKKEMALKVETESKYDPLRKVHKDKQAEELVKMARENIIRTKHLKNVQEEAKAAQIQVELEKKRKEEYANGIARDKNQLRQSITSLEDQV